MLAIRVPRAFDGVRPIHGGALVLVEDRRILGVQEWGAEAPADCAVLEFPDATLMPGLIDMHVHLCGDSAAGALDRLPSVGDTELDAIIWEGMRRQLAGGVTTVRDLGDRRWIVVEWRDRIASGWTGPPSPTIVASGPPITSPRGHCWSMGGEACGSAELRRAVRARYERRVDVIKIMASGGNLTPGTDVMNCQFTLEDMRVVVDEAHAVGLPVTAHAHGLPAVEQSLAAGVDGIEHCSCFTETGVTLPDALLEALAESDVAVCPTLGKLPGASPPPSVLELMARTGITWEGRQAMVGSMHRRGVTIVSGVDSGISDGKPHGSLVFAIADLVAGGVSNADSIASATSVAADHCGLGQRKGRLAAGLDADLLVVDGDPLKDIDALHRVRAVFVGGQRVEKT